MENTSSYKKATGTDIDILARTVAGEASDQYLAGQFAVAFTILARAKIAAAYVAKYGRPHPIFGDGTILSACKAPKQYSCWNGGDSNYARINRMSLRDEEYQAALYVALAVVLRQVSAALPTATHYYNPAAVTHIPAWVTGVAARDGKAAIPPAIFLSVIGQHRFYVEKA